MEPKEVLEELVGHSIIETHHGDGGIHIVLDDGRTLIIFGLGILSAENVLH